MLIEGEKVTLRPAEISDRRDIYEWLSLSDSTSAMMGPPLYPDHPAPSWEEYVADYADHYFDGSQPAEGRLFVLLAGRRPVGAVSYSRAVCEGALELDIWMRSESECGKGYGTDALKALSGFLAGELGVTEFVIRPSARNERAVRAYRKAGFEPVGPSEEARFGPGEYEDTVTLAMRYGGFV